MRLGSETCTTELEELESKIISFSTKIALLRILDCFLKFSFPTWSVVLRNVSHIREVTAGTRTRNCEFFDVRSFSKRVFSQRVPYRQFERYEEEKPQAIRRVIQSAIPRRASKFIRLEKGGKKKKRKKTGNCPINTARNLSFHRRRTRINPLIRLPRFEPPRCSPRSHLRNKTELAYFSDRRWKFSAIETVEFDTIEADQRKTKQREGGDFILVFDFLFAISRRSQIVKFPIS